MYITPLQGVLGGGGRGGALDNTVKWTQSRQYNRELIMCARKGPDVVFYAKTGGQRVRDD